MAASFGRHPTRRHLRFSCAGRVAWDGAIDLCLVSLTSTFRATGPTMPEPSPPLRTSAACRDLRPTPTRPTHVPERPLPTTIGHSDPRVVAMLAMQVETTRSFPCSSSSPSRAARTRRWCDFCDVPRLSTPACPLPPRTPYVRHGRRPVRIRRQGRARL